MSEVEIVRSIRRRLAQFDIQRIVLFGSRAKGQGATDSDWDFLIVANTTIPFIERQGAALKALGAHDYPVDLLLYTPEEHQRATEIPGSAVYWAERDGRVVYAK